MGAFYVIFTSGSQPGEISIPHPIPQGTLDNVWRGVGGAMGIYWVEALDSAEHSTTHSTAPTNNYLALNIQSAKVGDTCMSIVLALGVATIDTLQ